jgi:hypothetical protein
MMGKRGGPTIGVTIKRMAPVLPRLDEPHVQPDTLQLSDINNRQSTHTSTAIC